MLTQKKKERKRRKSRGKENRICTYKYLWTQKEIEPGVEWGRGRWITGKWVWLEMSLLVVLTSWTLWLSLPSLGKGFKCLQCIWHLGAAERRQGGGATPAWTWVPGRIIQSCVTLGEMLSPLTRPSVSWEHPKRCPGVTVQLERATGKPTPRPQHPVWAASCLLLPLPSRPPGNYIMKRNHRCKHFRFLWPHAR